MEIKYLIRKHIIYIYLILSFKKYKPELDYNDGISTSRSIVTD